MALHDTNAGLGSKLLTQFAENVGDVITDVFDKAREEAEARLQDGSAAAIKRLQEIYGQAAAAGDTTARPIYHQFASAAADHMKAEREKGSKKHDTLYLLILTDMQRRMDELDAEIDALMEKLKDKYGQDVVGGMAANFLDPEEMEGIRSDEELMQAMVDKHVGEDGKIRAESAHLFDENEAAILESYKEREKLKPKLDAWERELKETGGLSAETQREMKELIKVSDKFNLQEIDESTDKLEVKSAIVKESDQILMERTNEFSFDS